MALELYSTVYGFNIGAAIKFILDKGLIGQLATRSLY